MGLGEEKSVVERFLEKYEGRESVLMLAEACPDFRLEVLVGEAEEGAVESEIERVRDGSNWWVLERVREELVRSG